jgi:integrase
MMPVPDAAADVFSTSMSTIIAQYAGLCKLRTREYLTEAEVERLMKAVTRNRWGHRDSTMVLVAYRHGLRASEVVDLRWDQIEFKTANLHALPAPIQSSVTNCAPRGG